MTDLEGEQKHLSNASSFAKNGVQTQKTRPREWKKLDLTLTEEYNIKMEKKGNQT